MRVSEELVCIYLFRQNPVLPPCIWDIPFMSYRLRSEQKMREVSFESSGNDGDWLFTSGSVGGSRRDIRHSAGIRRSVSWRRMWSWSSWGRAATPPSSKERPHAASSLLHSVLRIQDILVWIRIRGSMPPNPDPFIFITDLQDANK